MLRDDRGSGERQPSAPRNVLGERLELCSLKPMTGFLRDGCCDTNGEDIGSHTVCAVMTAPFLEFSKSRGNDLSTPLPDLGFPGLKPGDRWCLCAPRWQEALQAGHAPAWCCELRMKALSNIVRSPISSALRSTSHNALESAHQRRAASDQMIERLREDGVGASAAALSRDSVAGMMLAGVRSSQREPEMPVIRRVPL